MGYKIRDCKNEIQPFMERLIKKTGSKAKDIILASLYDFEEKLGGEYKMLDIGDDLARKRLFKQAQIKITKMRHDMFFFSNLKKSVLTMMLNGVSIDNVLLNIKMSLHNFDILHEEVKRSEIDVYNDFKKIDGLWIKAFLAKINELRYCGYSKKRIMDIGLDPELIDYHYCSVTKKIRDNGLVAKKIFKNNNQLGEIKNDEK